MDKKKTNRGFDIVDFKDTHGHGCSLQKSSSAMSDRIWLGVNEAEPRIMCSDARKLGIRKIYGDERDNGWCDFHVPKEVLFTTRMHLSREQVGELLPYLIGFYLDGEIKKSRKIKIPKID